MSVPPQRPGEITVVTGATTGIGRALADRLAAAGHDLLIVARTEEELRDRAAELRRAHSVSVDYEVRDLADPDDLAGFCARLAGAPVGVLCANAGQGTFGAHAETPADRLHDQVALNCVGTHDVVRAVLPGMVSRGRGRVLLVGSTAGNQPVPGSATYAATKAFINSLSESLHQELRGTGVTTTVVVPGAVQTSFAERAGLQDAARSIPRPFWVSADRVAAAGLDALAHGRRRVAPGLVGTLLNFGGLVTPRPVLLPIVDAAISRFVRKQVRADAAKADAVKADAAKSDAA
jgi:short-subunit dehydrogenase